MNLLFLSNIFNNKGFYFILKILSSFYHVLSFKVYYLQKDLILIDINHRNN